MIIKPSYKKIDPKVEFIGRDFQLSKFQNILNSLESRDYSVINIFGVGGIGKSELLKKIRSELKSSDSNKLFFYDLELHQSIFKFYETLCEWVHNEITGSVYFQLAFMVYWKKNNPFHSDKERIPSFLKDGSVSSEIAFYFMEYLNSGKTKIIYTGLKKMGELFLDQTILSEIQDLQDMDIENIEQHMPKFLSYDLEKYYNRTNTKKKTIFLFDTYETLFENKKRICNQKVDTWIEDLVLSLNNRNELFIIAGRESLLWKDYEPEWEPFIFEFQLESLSKEETALLLKSSKIEEEEIIEAIINTSQGYPFYIKLFIETYHNQNIHNVNDFLSIKLDDIFKRFVKYLSYEELAILEYLSVPRFFDKSL